MLIEPGEVFFNLPAPWPRSHFGMGCSAITRQMIRPGIEALRDTCLAVSCAVLDVSSGPDQAVRNDRMNRLGLLPSNHRSDGHR